jgi:hypothetical protein
MSHHGAHHNGHNAVNYRDGAPHDGGFLDTRGMSQWATRRAGDLREVHDALEGTVYGSADFAQHYPSAEAAIGAAAVDAGLAPEPAQPLQHPQDHAWEQRFAVARHDIPH